MTLSLDILEQGKIHALIGPNGAGKTTLHSAQLCPVSCRPGCRLGSSYTGASDITGMSMPDRAQELGIARSPSRSPAIFDGLHGGGKCRHRGSGP